MELLSIGIIESKNKVLDTITNYDFIFNADIIEEKKGNRFFLKIITQDESITKKNNSVCNVLALLVTEIITRHYIKDLIYKKVFLKFDDLRKEEKIEIGKIAFNIINKDDFFSNEKNLIYNEVNNYIKLNDKITIDGFVNFRLNFLDSSIVTVIENSKEKYYEKKEFEEFIKILRYFVDIQEPKMDLVNIVIGESDYKLYDKDNQFIENDFFNEVINELSNDGISKEDLLISSIITIAPKCIVIHGNEKDNDNEVISIIESVFPDKVIYCTGCELCLLQMQINKEK